MSAKLGALVLEREQDKPRAAKLGALVLEREQDKPRAAKRRALSLEERRTQLEKRANVIRARLLHTIDTLDGRRQQVQELGHHAKRLARPIIASVVGAAVIALGTTLVIRAVVLSRRERRLGYRLERAVAPLWIPREAKVPIWKEALRRFALSAIGIITTEALRRSSRALLDRPKVTVVSTATPTPTMPLLGV
jgi:hypothetical protein